MKPFPLLAIVGLSLLVLPELRANEPSPAEARLREGLKNTMLQLRAAETERAALQAAQAQAAEEKKALEARVEAMTKQSVSDQDAITELREKIADGRAEITRLNESLEKWKKSHGEVTGVAQKKESERAAAASRVIVLERQVADQQRKNAEMFKIGNEILTRYERFGLGHALTAREPFVGITRVKLQNLVQDYGDKLADQKIKPE
jgi:chromosome segregation ATPase